MLVAAVVGGYAGARIARRLDARVIRAGVLLISSGMTVLMLVGRGHNLPGFDCSDAQGTDIIGGGGLAPRIALEVSPHDNRVRSLRDHEHHALDAPTEDRPRAERVAAQRILEAGTYAASGGNMQSWRFLSSAIDPSRQPPAHCIERRGTRLSHHAIARAHLLRT